MRPGQDERQDGRTESGTERWRVVYHPDMSRTTPECLQPQLRLRRALEAPLAAERPLAKGFSVRAYAPGDERAWARVLHENGQLGDWDEARVRAMIARGEPQMLLEGTFFALRGGEPVATACSLRHRSPAPGRELLEIGWVGVVPSARGHGLAYILSRRILAHWQPRVVGDVFILTDDWRVAAIVTYLRLGFRPEIVHPNQVERWRRLSLGFEGELREWAAPDA
jgi:mycothiol synthase